MAFILSAVTFGGPSVSDHGFLESTTEVNTTHVGSGDLRGTLTMPLHREPRTVHARIIGHHTLWGFKEVRVILKKFSHAIPNTVIRIVL